MEANFRPRLSPGSRARKYILISALLIALFFMGSGVQSAQEGSTLMSLLESLGIRSGQDEENLPPPELSAPHPRPLVLYSNTEVEGVIRYLLDRKDDLLVTGYRRSGRYLPMIRRILAEEGVPLELAYLVAVESNFHPQARSSMNAAGLWQLMVPTARRFGLKVRHPWYDERLDPEKATRAAARLLGYLYDRFGSWELALAAYNAGEGRLRSVMQRAQDKGVSLDYWSLPLPLQTQGFVPTFLAMTQIHSHPEAFGLSGIAMDAPLQGDTLEWNIPTTLEAVANRLNAPKSLLETLNPAWRLGLIPPDNHGPVVLRLPAGSAERLLDSLAVTPPPAIPWLMHRVAPGESFNSIAREYGVVRADLLALNGLQRRSRLIVNQSLLIPLPAETLTDANGAHVIAQGQLPITEKNTASPALTELVLVRVESTDSLWHISRRLDVTMSELRHWNGLKDNQLKPGQILAAFPEQHGGAKGKESLPLAQR